MGRARRLLRDGAVLPCLRPRTAVDAADLAAVVVLVRTGRGRVPSDVQVAQERRAEAAEAAECLTS